MQTFNELVCGTAGSQARTFRPLRFDAALINYYASHAKEHNFWMSKLEYCKVHAEPGHEFVLLHVRKSAEERTPCGYIIVHRLHGDVALFLNQQRIRNVNLVLSAHTFSDSHVVVVPAAAAALGSPPPPPLPTSESLSSDVVTVPADDLAVFLNNREAIKDYDARDYQVLTTIDFAEDEVTLAHVIAAGVTVSRSASNYRALGHQCYWFALVFGSLLSQGKLEESLKEIDGGKYSFQRFKATVVDPDVVAEDTKALITQYVAEFKKCQGLKSIEEAGRETEKEKERANLAEKRAATAEQKMEKMEEKMEQLEKLLQSILSGQVAGLIPTQV